MNNVRERMGGRRMGAWERMRGKGRCTEELKDGGTLAGRTRRLTGCRMGESRCLAGLLVGECKHTASPATEHWRLVGCLMGVGRALGKEARGELG